jgi:hypothetical protein
MAIKAVAPTQGSPLTESWREGHPIGHSQYCHPKALIQHLLLVHEHLANRAAIVSGGPAGAERSQSDWPAP